MSPEPVTRQSDPGKLVIEWQGTYSRAFQRCLNLLGALGVDLIDADPNHGFLAGRIGPSMGGLGVNVRIDFQTHLNRTHLTVQSKPRLKLLDWGAAEALIVRFKEA